MSKTTPVEFRGRGFWAFDVSLSILLAELIDIAEALEPEQRPPWLADVLPQLRIHAVVGDFLFDLDFDLEDEPLDEFIAPIAELGEAIIQLLQGTLPPPPAGTWWSFGFSGGPGTVAMRDPISRDE